MGLQIRVRHALGERVIELPDRLAEEPIIVGRASNAEVSVPSVTVAPKHCVLFIHEGHWAIQDLGAGGGTYVNGEPVVEARFLQIGDVVSVGADASAPTIEVDPAAAAEGRTGYAGTGLPHLQAQEHAPAYGSYAAYGAGPAVPQAPAQIYGAPGYAGVAVRQPAAASHFAAEHPAHHDHIDHHDHDHVHDHHHDAHSVEPAVASRPFTRRQTGSNTTMIVGMVIAAVVIVGGVFAAVMYVQNKNAETVRLANLEQQRRQKEADEEAARRKSEANKTNNIFGIPNAAGGPSTPTPPRPAPPRPGVEKPAPRVPSGGTPGNPPTTPEAPATTPPPEPTPSTPATPKPAGSEDGVDPITPPPGSDPAKPAKPAGSEDGVDPIKKPANGGTDGMDPIKKPAAPPPGKDPETMDPATAASWQAMQDLAAQHGKDSFAVLRFEDFKRLNPGKYDAQIDEFIDKKLDRIWWERIDQLMKKIERLNIDIPKLHNEIVDINDQAVKKQKINEYGKMQEELKVAAKTLKEVMKYDGNDPPNLNSEAELASLAAKRDKFSYDNWKRITINYIKANQGRLAWANDF